MTLNYNELLELADTSIAELKQYVNTYEEGKIDEFTANTLKVLDKLKEIAVNQEKIESYVISAVHDISVAAVKVYEDTELKDAILNIRRFFMKSIPDFEGYPSLGMKFKKYF